MYSGEPVREKPTAYPELYPIPKLGLLAKGIAVTAGLMAFLLVSLLMTIFELISVPSRELIISLAFYFFILVFLVLIGLVYKRMKTKRRIKENEERIRAYESTVNAANQRIAQTQAKNQARAAQIQAQNDQLEFNRRAVQEKLEQVRRELEEYYAVNVIDPHYRGLAPISLIHHYISTGICSELKGPDGAYSRCRTEMREDRFQSSVGAKLDTISANQKTIFSILGSIRTQFSILDLAIRESNEAARNISSAVLENNMKMDRFLTQSEDMKRFARESAESSRYLSEFVSKNRENLERHIMP